MQRGMSQYDTEMRLGREEIKRLRGRRDDEAKDEAEEEFKIM